MTRHHTCLPTVLLLYPLFNVLLHDLIVYIFLVELCVKKPSMSLSIYRKYLSPFTRSHQSSLLRFFFFSADQIRSDPRCGKEWCYVDPCACAISEPPKVLIWT